MKKPARVLRWVLLGLLGSALGGACGADNSLSRSPGTGAVSGNGGQGVGDGMTVEPPGMGGAGGEPEYNVLCGVVNAASCVPDDAESSTCRPGRGGGAGGPTATAGRAGASEGGAPGSGAGQAGEAGGEAGAAGAESGGDGAGGERPSGPSSGAGGRGNAGGAGRSGSGGAANGGRAGDGSPPRPVVESCQVQSVRGEPRSLCAPSGDGLSGDPCFSGADCAAGLACVGNGPGQCRPFCCGGDTVCGTFRGTRCSEELLVGAVQTPTSPTPRVPVCVPAIECGLAEPYPCAAGVTCSCPTGSACMVVGDDGTTSCVPASTLPREGHGMEGQACPCAWNHVCSKATNKCLKLCQSAAAEVDCESDRCQASPDLPPGWGVCVGVAPADGG